MEGNTSQVKVKVYTPMQEVQEGKDKFSLVMRRPGVGEQWSLGPGFPGQKAISQRQEHSIPGLGLEGSVGQGLTCDIPSPMA